MVAGVNAGRHFAKVITLVTTNGTRLICAEDDRLEWRSVNVGTGLTDPSGKVIVDGMPV